MIPEKPNFFEPASLEDIMFDSLASLPDDYFVFHSFKLTSVEQNVFRESETDFVIFNRKRGVICLEAKAGQVNYKNGCWIYANGTEMRHGGPFNQASTNKWKLIRYIENSHCKDLLNKCKFLHAVWFPSILDSDLKKIVLPSNADRKLIMTKADLDNPEASIKDIFEIKLENHNTTNLSDIDVKRLLQNILCPAFEIIPTASFEADIKKIAFHRLLREQAGILNYLGDQLSAVINGVAGTGKTMIAIEKAKQHAAAEEKVLFLCYNSKLKKHLAENFSNEYISYFTIDGLACKMCHTNVANYKKLKLVLEDIYFSGNFEYKHVIIDEGQDFGQEVLEESDIIQLLKDIVVDNDKTKGTFYIFYDKLQLIQGDKIPKYIAESDCKLTLYRNCRNTENIAITSMRPLTEHKPKLFEGCVKGAPPIIHYCINEDSIILETDRIIESLLNEGIKDIVILTCKTEEKSKYAKFCCDGLYKGKISFSTCRKFKGLEADSVILVDLDSESFYKENILLYYVGTSRARIKLDIIASLSSDDCKNILINILNSKTIPRKPFKELASALSAVGEIVDIQ